MEIKDWILKNIKRDSIILEAGTADGEDTLFFSNHCDLGHVYGFEPVVELFEQTVYKTKDKENITLYNKALAEEDGILLNMHISSRKNRIWGSSSILKPKTHINHHPQIKFNSERTVSTRSIDAWFLENNLNKIDLMWLDLQGYEPVVTLSSKIALKNTKYLYTEVSIDETYEGVSLYDEYISQLKIRGFKIVFEDMPWKDMGNILLVNNG